MLPVGGEPPPATRGTKSAIMPDTYVIKDQHATYFMTFRVVRWLDVFSRSRYCDIVIASLNYCVENKGLVIFSWVIMSNHMHLIVRSRTGRLSETIRDLKRHTARTIVESIKKDPESRRSWLLQIMTEEAHGRSKKCRHQFWAYTNHAVELPPTNIQMMMTKFNYVHVNPIVAGLVSSAEDYLYSSAGDCAGSKGPVKIELLDTVFFRRL